MWAHPFLRLKERKEKMKIKGRIIGIIMLLMLIGAALTPSVFAMSETEADNTNRALAYPSAINSDIIGREDVGDYIVADEPGDEGVATDSENGIVADAPGGENSISNGGEAGGVGDNEAEGNIFSELFALAGEYSGEIFSLLSLLASLILAYLYKSGLTPLVKNTLGALGKTVTSIRESAERGEEKASVVTGALTERLEICEGIITKLSEAIERVSQSLEQKEAEAGERMSLKVVLGAQIDMLYEIFMTSALPEYKKNAVGERITKMREAIGIDEARD